jgi:hypothetical protein
VLVSREHERWLGRRADRDAAVRAVRKMFTPHSAQHLLSRVQLDEAPAAGKPSAAQHEDQPSDKDSPDLWSAIDDGIPGEEVAIAIDAVIGSEAAAKNAMLLEPVPEGAADAGPPTAATPPWLASTSVERRIILPEPARTRPLPKSRESCARSSTQSQRSPVMSPRLVQLNMLVWLCRARAHSRRFQRTAGCGGSSQA